MRNQVVCLFEHSGYSARPWLEDGFDVWCYDILHEELTVEEHSSGGRLFKCPWDATDDSQNQKIIERHRDNTSILMSFPPCTDLAVSGAAHFKAKFERDPDHRVKAMAMVRLGEMIGSKIGCPWVVENPVSVISSEWRKPDHMFHPWEFGGYLPEDDVHPVWPDYIKARDAYPKKTCYWTSKDFIFPDKLPVQVPAGYSAQHTKLGGKSAKTKAIRSFSPRGVAKAIWLFNHLI